MVRLSGHEKDEEQLQLISCNAPHAPHDPVRSKQTNQPVVILSYIVAILKRKARRDERLAFQEITGSKLAVK
ncbi:MAG: hypothetical protein ACRD3W_13375, partial [Terriglobales bacterium]